MNEYNFAEYLRRVRYVKGVEDSGLEFGRGFKWDDESLSKKRELLKLLYENLIGEGGIHIPIDKCKPSRINSAFRREYDRSQRLIRVYQEIRLVIERTQALLDLEARVSFAFASEPLFAEKPDKVRQDVNAYLAGLNKLQRAVVEDYFGDKIKLYL